MISWGTFLLCNVAAKNKGGLYVTRFLLGAVRLTSELFFLAIEGRGHENTFANIAQAEAGQFPGVILQMTYWYRPDEMSLRLLYFCTLFHTPDQSRDTTANQRQISAETFRTYSVVFLPTALTLYLAQLVCLDGNGKQWISPLLDHGEY
jgi:hypothetical protein